MSLLDRLYRPSLSLLTDLYQITMAYGFWKTGMPEHEAVFNLFFRKNPFDSGYTIACGLSQAIEYLERFHVDEEDRDYLASLVGNDGKPLFERPFLDWLGTLRPEIEIDAVPEGTVMFANEPLLRVRGPIITCQLLETPLLNMINFQTLIATKAARICHATGGDPVIDFGLRRAQGIDGALSASRAAYVGGCAATSNVLAGRLLGMPVRGTQAHSWVMFFDDEREAFLEYAKVMPNNCLLLVDTYDTLEGTRKAAETGRWLAAQGHKFIGVRLDSGDLAYLSIEARKILDEAGLHDASIVASNELDEEIIVSLKQQGAKIDVWGVGTRLITAYDEPALGGVYKLAAVRKPGEDWRHKIKLSEQGLKTSTPGMLQVRRYRHEGEFVGDAIWDEIHGEGEIGTLVDPLDMTRRKRIPEGSDHQDLLQPVFRDGARVGELPDLAAARDNARRQLDSFHDGVKRFVHPHSYPVGLEPGLHDLKTALILEARGKI